MLVDVGVLALDEIQTPGIGRRDLAALAQDQLEQLGEVVLCGERDPDRVQLLEIPGLLVECCVELLDRLPAALKLASTFQPERQQRRRNGTRQHVVQERKPLDHLVHLVGLRDGDQSRTAPCEALFPALQVCAVRNDEARVDHDRDAGGADGRAQPLQRVDLLERRHARGLASNQLSRLTPDEDIDHDAMAPVSSYQPNPSSPW